jgi:hypothetical protein
MKLPAWAQASHPVARRERAVWHQIYSRWGWLLLLLALLPCGCSALCSLSSVPAVFAADTPTIGLLVLFAWIILVGVWLTSGLWAWILGTVAGVGGAIMVAREREMLNWSLLRLTTLTIREILAAKLAALGRILWWPAIAILSLETAGVTLMVIGGVIGILIAGRTDPADFPLELQVEIIILLVGLWPLSVFYLVFTNVLNLAYNGALGLLTSTFTRTSGNAVGLTLVASFAINLLIFLPIQQLVGVVLQALGGLLTIANSSPAPFLVFTSLASFLLPIIIQLSLTILMLVWAVHQSESIAE